MKIHLLDVGEQQYGDCILAVHEDRRILIDGGHPRDAELIGRQLRRLLGDPPHRIDLLIVTHGHADHYGCLPELVDTEVIEVQQALVADEELCWPTSRQRDDSGGEDDAPAPLPGSTRQILNEALLEEPLTDASDEEVLRFLEDAVSGEQKYRGMLAQLPGVLRYGQASDAEIEQLEQDFASFGLDVLGPTVEHLRTCADFIYRESRQRRDDVPEADDLPVATDLVTAYRKAVKREIAAARHAADAADAEDRMGAGSARNNQSIVIKLSADGFSALLAGDMQFAAAEVPNLDDSMEELREVVREAGPYDFVKLTHHTSYNGVDEGVLDDYPGCRNFAHTGGLYDPTHPDPGVLDLLSERASDIYFARTDRNGLITVSKSGDRVRMHVQRGSLNNFQLNRRRPRREDLPGAATPELEVVATEQWARDYVEVTAKIPHRSTRVTLTIDVDPEKKKLASFPRPEGRDPGKKSKQPNPSTGGPRTNGRFSELLFVTVPAVLQENIGRNEAEEARKTVLDAGGRLLQVERGQSAEAVASQVRDALRDRVCKGVVILGGPDVIPSERLNVIDDALRRRVDDFIVRTDSRDDSDDFIVWSDDLYGDLEGDRFAELPVSRIPDGRKASVVLAALKSAPVSSAERFGVRNIDRPFAEDIFSNLPGAAAMLVSQPTSPDSLARTAATGSVYYMLHGLDTDGTRYWGEDGRNGSVEAVDVSNIPSDAKGSIVFLGCCWGSLASTPTARRATGGFRIRPRTPEQSIALAYLDAGASAVVGCTGTHYSPTDGDFAYYGQPIHVEFWKRVASGSSPAKAIFEAKAAYGRGIPHGPRDPFSIAVELKIWRQYSCLGLGW